MSTKRSGICGIEFTIPEVVVLKSDPPLADKVPEYPAVWFKTLFDPHTVSFP
jgi:hypothetical protein